MVFDPGPSRSTPALPLAGWCLTRNKEQAQGNILWVGFPTFPGLHSLLSSPQPHRQPLLSGIRVSTCQCQRSGPLRDPPHPLEPQTTLSSPAEGQCPHRAGASLPPQTQTAPRPSPPPKVQRGGQGRENWGQAGADSETALQIQVSQGMHIFLPACDSESCQRDAHIPEGVQVLGR